MAHALDTGADPARAELRHIVGRDVRALDEHGIARAAIESGAENYSDGVVAPAFWYLLFGLPGLLAYKAINTMDSMIGHRSPRHHAFGRAAARIDDAVNWAPARIAGGLIAAAAVVVPGAAPGRAWDTMVRDAPRHSSPNAGWPEAAMAGALGLALLGPRRYEGEAAADEAWLGDGRKDATADDVRRTVWVFARVRAGSGAHRRHHCRDGAQRVVAEAQRARATSSRQSRSRWASRWAARASRVCSTRAS